MSLVKRIQLLCDENKTSFAEVERKVGLSNGQIRRWNNSSPKTKNVEKIADYFDVSVDYLIGRTDKKNYYELTDKDERDIEKEIESILNNFNDSGFAMLDGRTPDDLDPEDRELLVASLEQSLRIAKRIAKEKFTPKKYRN